MFLFFAYRRRVERKMGHVFVSMAIYGTFAILEV